MAMRFEPVAKDSGFELTVAGAIPWQMVPAGGSRSVILHEAADYRLQLIPAALNGGQPGGASFTETPSADGKKREIKITGVTKGKYLLQVVSPSHPTPVYELAVEVMNERKVKAAFYFLPGMDTKKFDVAALVKKINEIWTPQAAVSVSSLGVWDNSNGMGIKINSAIEIEKDAAELRHYGEHAAANWLVYFGWTIATSEKGKVTNGVTRINQTVIDLTRYGTGDAAKLGHTLAHELGHYVVQSTPQHDTEKTDLMFDLASPGGTNNKIRKKRCQMVVRP